MSNGSQDPRQNALDQLAEALAGSKFRELLIKDVDEAAKSKSLDVANLPKGLLTTLGEMNDEELKLVGLVQRQLKPFPDSVSILF